ncbi:MAG: hypothetical protein AAF399_01415 [Bacteroidota bacterium]
MLEDTDFRPFWLLHPHLLHPHALIGLHLDDGEAAIATARSNWNRSGKVPLLQNRTDALATRARTQGQKPTEDPHPLSQTTLIHKAPRRAENRYVLTHYSP